MTQPPAIPPDPDDGDRRDAGREAGRPAEDGASGLHSNGFPNFGLRRDAGLDPTEFIGREIDGYRIIRAIGEGGMSVVFEAEQRIPRRSVAFKICNPGGYLAKRLIEDAECLKGIDHPFIARVLAGGEVESRHGPLPYMVTELVTGARPLTHYCWQELPGIRDRVALFTKVCLAVAHCHGRRPSLVHRDLKPGNILVDAEGRPKVIDFGIARAATVGPGMQATVTIVGTPGYMSPEQLRGTDAAPSSDVFSLGVILKEVLLGTPGTRDPDDPGAAAPPSRLPHGLGRIISRCQHGDPARRFADASHLERALHLWLRWHAPRWVAWRTPACPTATRRWLAAHGRRILLSSLAALLGAATLWAVFIRPDMPSFVRAVATAAEAVTAERGADGARAINDAKRIWGLVRPFAASPPLEIACLTSRVCGAAQGRLVSSTADVMAVRSHPDSWAAVGSAGGVALVDVGGAAGGLMRRLGSPARISAVVFSADDARVIAGDASGRVLIWDTARLTGGRVDTTPRRVALPTPHAGAVLAIAVPTASFRKADWCLALDTAGGISRIESPADGKEPHAELVTMVSGGCDISLLDSGRLLAIATVAGTVEFRDLARPEGILRSETVGSAPIDLARDAAGRVLYAAASGKLAIWRNPRSIGRSTASLPPAREGTAPRVVVATADACLIALEAGDRASLHCFRDARDRFDTAASWQETLAVTVPSQVLAAALIPGTTPALAVLDARGYLTTNR
ncbi:MAG: protein kinase domain-containing protein [Planctomycetia bacterium]